MEDGVLKRSFSKEKSPHVFSDKSLTLSSLTIQAMHRLSIIPTIHNNFPPEYLYSETYHTPFLCGSALVIISQFTGYYVITTDSISGIININSNIWLLVGAFVGLITTLADYYLIKYI